MTEIQNSKRVYDLEERTFLFAKRSRDYIKLLPHSYSHIEYGKQLIRSSGSVAANWIEANEALSKKDFLMRAKICRKEAKESILWFRLTEPKDNQKNEKEYLINEVTQLMKIFVSIISSNG